MGNNSYSDYLIPMNEGRVEGEKEVGNENYHRKSIGELGERKGGNI
ncbi:MAG: hypothetical protein JSV09_12575 [Thermoplasmata archaeon]|nr:MAG: hypothetical protein JSV09_12575 [Thermoplasmata archaeon]